MVYFAPISLQECTIKFCDGRQGTVTIGAGTAGLVFTDASKHRGSRAQPTVTAVTGGGALSVATVGTDLTITLAAAGSTAAQVKAACDADPTTAAVFMTTLVTPPGSGTFLIASKTPLANGPRVLAVKIGNGNLMFDETTDRVYILDRDILDDVKNAPQTPLMLKVDSVWINIAAVIGSGTPTPYEAALGIGEANNSPSIWVNTSDNPCQPYAIDVEFHDIPQCPGVLSEYLMFECFSAEDFDFDIKASTMNFSGKCNRQFATTYRQ